MFITTRIFTFIHHAAFVCTRASPFRLVYPSIPRTRSRWAVRSLSRLYSIRVSKKELAAPGELYKNIFRAAWLIGGLIYAGEFHSSKTPVILSPLAP